MTTCAALALGSTIGAVPATAEEVPAVWRFDLQPVGTPVMAGFTEVNRTMQYTPERTYGFAAIEGMGDRDRGKGTDIQRDFVLGGELVVDVPNGTYSVKTYSGDMNASSRTSFTIEGRSVGNGDAGSGVVNESTRGPIQVTDGQLNISASGSSPRFNGAEIFPILLAPLGLSLSGEDTDPGDPSVSLSWEDAEDVSWNVYRTSPYDAEPQLIGHSETTTFVDETVRVGLPYDYFVTAVDSSSLESVPSNSVSASLTDGDVAVPAAASDLELGSISKNEIVVSWTPAENTLYSAVFRSEVAGERGEFIGFADGTQFADGDVLTTIPYHYTVVGMNAGGASADSEQLATEAVTVLQRQVEYLDRAPHAVRVTGGNLVAWRMLGTDPDGIGFHVYRDGTRITDEPITGSTNLLDGEGSAESAYFVTKVLGDVETTETDDFGVQTGEFDTIPLQKPADTVLPDGVSYSYSAGDTSVADADGDGRYEYFVKWEANARDSSKGGYSGNVLLDAYRADGTLLWRIDLGRNIRAGAHYTQFQVYDLNGDGRAELTAKTADGTVDGVGTVIGDANADYRNDGGWILEGPEYFTVFDGLTGAAVDTVDYTPPRGDVAAWGDGYGNRVDRFLSGVAYLDGEHPSVLTARGYYTRTVVAAYDFDGAELTQRWVIDSNDEENRTLAGQGNHSLSIADVDGDAKDEIVYGSATIDDDGSLLYSTGLGHGDALHVSDLVPSRPGLEIFAAHESMSSSGNRGATMRDAATGEILWDIPADRDTGRAAAGDIDPRHAGSEGWAVGGTASWDSQEGYLMAASGERIGSAIPAANFLAWFDGDPLREIVDHNFDGTTGRGVPTVSKWNWETNVSEPLVVADDSQSLNWTKGNPSIQADLFGDWREELVWPSADYTELHVYSTTDVTDLRLRTLMHDTQYRTAVAWQNTGYNQPPHPSFFLGDGMETPVAPRITVTAAPSQGEDASAPTVSGLPEPGALVAETQSLTVEAIAEDPESGVRNFDITFDGEPVAPGQVIELDQLTGSHVLAARAVNHDGLVTTASAEVLVFTDEAGDEKPGRGRLSADSGWTDGLHDGTFTVSMNLHHGTNGSGIRLYENGELIATRLLPPHSPDAQLAAFEVADRPNGNYEYTAELINARGATPTMPVTVTVKDAEPGKPVLSHDNWDRDESYAITASMWWGTNGSAYRLYENGVLVDEQQLIANSPHAQQAKTEIGGRAAGTYVYSAEFVNAAGATTSKEIKVEVR